MRSCQVFSFILALVVTAVFSTEGYCAEVKPLKSSASFKACAKQDSIVTTKGVCYVYNLQTKEESIQVTVGTGINVNFGKVIFGGSVSGLLEVTMEFPLETSNDDVLRSAKKELDRHLKDEKLKGEIESKVAKELDLDPDSIEILLSPQDYSVEACFEKSDDEKLFEELEELRKATGAN